MKTYTIGFTQKSAERFFQFIKQANIKTVIDVRLNNKSQLSGFAKKDDLRFFLKELCATDYLHLPELTPTKALLNRYKKHGDPWSIYEAEFLNLMAQRNIEHSLTPDLFERGCLLCSEHEPHFCHRRLVVEYLNTHWDAKLNIKHLY
jgi:uncharacterized protein (DUF488 family)